MSYKHLLFASMTALILIGSPSLAFAQDSADDEREIVEATDEQLRLNQEGVEALVKNEPARAVALLSDASRLGELNILALNLGRAYHALGQCERAREQLELVFEHPVVERPSADRVNARAEEYIVELDETCVEDEAAEIESPDATEQPAVDDDDTTTVTEPDDVASFDGKTWGLYTIGAGSVLAATGLGFHLMARSQRSGANDRLQSSSNSDVNTEITQQEAAQIESRANLYDTIGLAAAITGVATAAVGTYLFMASPELEEESTTVGFGFSADAWTFSFSHRF